jgi:hypothetical protein
LSSIVEQPLDHIKGQLVTGHEIPAVSAADTTQIAKRSDRQHNMLRVWLYQNGKLLGSEVFY